MLGDKMLIDVLILRNNNIFLTFFQLYGSKPYNWKKVGAKTCCLIIDNDSTKHNFPFLVPVERLDINKCGTFNGVSTTVHCIFTIF